MVTVALTIDRTCAENGGPRDVHRARAHGTVAANARLALDRMPALP